MASPTKKRKAIGPYSGSHPGLKGTNTWKDSHDQAQIVASLRHRRVLSSTQIAFMLTAAGMTNFDGVVTGMAVASCESANGANRGPLKGGKCNTAGACGPFQIGVGGVGSSAASDHGVSIGCANDWLCACQKVVEMTGNGSNWGDWAASQACWEPKKAKMHDIAAKYFGGTESSDLLAKVGDAADAVGGAIGDALNSLDFIARLFSPAFWLRVGKGILGFALLLYGAQALSKALLGIDLAGPAQTLASALARQSGLGAANPAEATVSPRARVSSRVTKYRTKGSRVVANKTKVKPVDDVPF